MPNFAPRPRRSMIAGGRSTSNRSPRAFPIFQTADDDTSSRIMESLVRLSADERAWCMMQVCTYSIPWGRVLARGGRFCKISRYGQETTRMKLIRDHKRDLKGLQRGIPGTPDADWSVRKRSNSLQSMAPLCLFLLVQYWRGYYSLFV